MKKKMKAWAIMPSFIDSKEIETLPYLTNNKQLMVYLTKKAAEKENARLDEIVVPCEITFQ